jgi:hypothetical protein
VTVRVVTGRAHGRICSRPVHLLTRAAERMHPGGADPAEGGRGGADPTGGGRGGAGPAGRRPPATDPPGLDLRRHGTIDGHTHRTRQETP